MQIFVGGQSKCNIEQHADISGNCDKLYCKENMAVLQFMSRLLRAARLTAIITGMIE